MKSRVLQKQALGDINKRQSLPDWLVANLMIIFYDRSVTQRMLRISDKTAASSITMKGDVMEDVIF